MVKNLLASTGDVSSTSGSGGSPDKEVFQCSCLENPMDGEPVRLGLWGYQRAPTQLSDCTTKANLKCMLSLDTEEDNFWQPRHPSAVTYAAFPDDTVLPR